MNEYYNVEKGIPLPDGQPKWRLLASLMEVGDSVVVKNSGQVQALSTAFRHEGFKAISQCLIPEGESVPPKERHKRPHRVWKIEDKQ